MRTAARVAAVVGVVLLILALRVVTGARTELRRGDRLAQDGDHQAAEVAYRRAASWYLPGNPYSTEALDRLVELAQASDDPERELRVWRSVRGAILNTRSVYLPHRARLRRANARIAALVSEASRDGNAPVSADEVERELRPIVQPHLGYALLALIGWIAWTAGAFVFAQRAIDEEDRVLAAPARFWGTVVVVGFGVFALGLALA